MTDLTPLPPELMIDAGPDQVAADYLRIIADAIENHPRTLQEDIGPSEIGCPCPRRIVYKLLRFPEQPGRPNWKATVGTGVHLWLESAFDRDNLVGPLAELGQERWYVETRVHVGDVNGQPVTGSCDLFDRVTGTVIDHKTCGPTQLKKYRSQGPGEQYQVQAHLYGLGWVRAGLPVNRVMTVFLPRNGELRDAFPWSEPFDPVIAVKALQRLEGLDLAARALGPLVLDQLPAVDAYCGHCPYLNRGSTDLAFGCPGADGALRSQEPALTFNTGPNP